VLSVELHCHSALSYDAHDPLELLLEQAAAVGLDAIAVTDHDEIDVSLRAPQIAAEYGLVAIPGIEVSSAAGHVLGLGVREAIPPGLTFMETVDRIRGQDGIVILPHPFQTSRHGVASHITETELACADAIEVYNSRLLTGLANQWAESFARDHGLPMTAGSDAHISEMVGQAVTRVKTADRTPAAILRAIRDGETDVVGKRTPWRISLKQFGGGIRRRIVSGIRHAL
jgi:predicted metal-dependent phosphoesterase TrpH